MGKRDRVIFEPNERVDLPDLAALQRNLWTALRRQTRHLLFGSGSGVYSPADRAVQVPWVCTPSGTQITVARGLAWAGETLDDGTTETGHATGGLDGDASQTLDFNGEPAATYYVWVRAAFDPAQPGARIFWDAALEEEVPQSIDTREVSGWKAVFTNSSSPPDDRYVLVAVTAWDGSNHTVTPAGVTLLFEGKLDAAGAEDTATRWGDGPNDRNADRASYGVRSLLDWTSAVRRQLAGIIGDPWYTAIPTSVRLATATTLKVLRDHLDLTTDPHGASLTQTTLVRVLAGGTLRSDGTLDVNGPADFADEIVAHDNIQLAGVGTDALPRFTAAGDTSESGYLVVRQVHPSKFLPDVPDAANISWGTGRNSFRLDDDSARVFTLDLTDLFNGVELASNGPFLSEIYLYGQRNNNTSFTTIAWTLVSRAVSSASLNTLVSGNINNTDFDNANPSAVLLDLSAAAAATRIITTPTVFVLVMSVVGTSGNGGSSDQSPTIYGATVWARHKYLHP